MQASLHPPHNGAVLRALPSAIALVGVHRAGPSRRGEEFPLAEKSDKKSSRCWPGFEPVPGKAEHEQGSCKPKAKSKNNGKAPDRERSRKEQVAQGGARAKQAKAKSPNAGERRSVSKTAAKKAPAKKTAAKRTSTKKAAA